MYHPSQTQKYHNHFNKVQDQRLNPHIQGNLNTMYLWFLSLYWLSLLDIHERRWFWKENKDLKFPNFPFLKQNWPILQRKKRSGSVHSILIHCLFVWLIDFIKSAIVPTSCSILSLFKKKNNTIFFQKCLGSFKNTFEIWGYGKRTKLTF